MKYLKYATFCILGMLLSTAIFYVGLAALAALFFEPGDSYFDRAPRVADAVFFLWLLTSLASGAVGVWWARRRK